MKLFNRLDKLMIVLFWEIIEQQNPLLLDPEFADEKEYTEEQKKEASDAWAALYDEYFLLENDAMTKAALKENFEVIAALNKINLLVETMNYFMFVCNHGALLSDDEFADLKQAILAVFKKTEKRMDLKYFGTVQQNLDIVNKWIKSLTNSYEIRHKRSDKAVEKQKQNIYDMVASVGTALGMQLNVKEMSVKEWLAYKKIAKAKTTVKPKNITPDGKQ